MGKGDIPVVLMIDAEPDGTSDVTPGRWSGVLATHRWLTDLRPRIHEVTGNPAVYSWFLRMDPQVEEVHGSASYAVDAHPEVFADVQARGEPLGLHPHAWRNLPDAGWVEDYADADWLDHCIDRSFDAFRLVFGERCTLSRIGAHYMSARAIARLAHHGVEIDLTGEPARGAMADGTRVHLRGTVPDYRRMPRRPYRPAATDPCRAARRGEAAAGLVELPLTACRRPSGHGLRAHASRHRHHGLGQRLDAPLTLAANYGPDDSFAARLDGSLRTQRRPHLVLAFRSSGRVDPVKGPRLDEQLDALLRHPAARRMVFMSPDEALEHLDVA
jgi:hypothetical protein